MLPPPTATDTGGVFPLPTRHLLKCIHTNEYVLQLALCGGGCMYMWWLCVVWCDVWSRVGWGGVQHCVLVVYVVKVSAV